MFGGEGRSFGLGLEHPGEGVLNPFFTGMFSHIRDGLYLGPPPITASRIGLVGALDANNSVIQCRERTFNLTPLSCSFDIHSVHPENSTGNGV